MASRKKAARSVKKKAVPRSRTPRTARGVRSRTASPRPKSTARAATARRTRTTTRVPAMTLPAPNGRPVGTGIGLTRQHMDFSSHDLAAMRRFFAETLGFTNVNATNDDDMTVFVTPTSSLGFRPPASTAPDQWQPPGEPNLYFFVSDVDAVFAKLSAEGVLFDQAPTDMPGGQRLAVLRDPEGRRVCLAQNLER